MSDTLRKPVREFVAGVAPAMAELGSDDPSADVVAEAYEIVSAMVDADGAHSDTELWALIGAFSGLMDTHIHHATPADLRAMGMMAGKRVFVDKPSLMFDTLVAADQSKQTSHAWTYYVHALRLAHHVVALDHVTQHVELQAIERFRRTLLTAISSAGLPRGPRDSGRRSTTNDAPVAQAAAQAEADTDAEVAVELPPARPLEELLAELDELVGLDAVKSEVKLVTNLLQVQKLRAEKGLKVSDSSRHLIFTGNPGTGKTTVARLIAQIYRTLEVVPKGHLVETDRSGLVAGFVGQTAANVVKVFDSARGGVLLIDEAYSLVRGGEKDFGREAIDSIVKLVEDRRDDTVVIMAGYPDEMADLMGSNPGLVSRFPQTIHFPDYTTDELVTIAGLIAEGNEYSFDDGARERLAELLDEVPRDRGFGNGRLARNVFEQAVAIHASRMVELLKRAENPTGSQARGSGAATDDEASEEPSAELLQTLTAEDLPGEITTS
ncbi:AAA family ATPase [Euzebya tangerina]|uniref:AAA family ATPase n=1 Tax=Euzebya tangerina TaxID=591198 RepID=UPI000E31EB3A|nr:AAA family ATPase [Euzebya tangerina]